MADRVTHYALAYAGQTWQRQALRGDVLYWHRKINALFTGGLDRTLYECPTPVV
jgi:hypothetical protein